MTPLYVVIGLVAAQRLAELVWAHNNTRNLLAAGGIEVGRGHYPLFVLLHAGWLIAILLAVPANTPPRLGHLGFFGLLMIARLWVIASLGPFWTTRIITVPGMPLVRRGPYRFMRHPNYAVVMLEIAILPLAFHAYAVALVFSVANAALLVHRVRIEEQALAARRIIA